MVAKHTLPVNSYVRFPKTLRFLFVQFSVIAKTSIILTQISSFSRAAKYSNECACKKNSHVPIYICRWRSALWDEKGLSQ